MPIFEVDGQQFEVEDKYVSDFAKEYPNAVTKVDSEDAIYEVSASDYPAYLDTQRAPRRVVPEKTTIPGSHAKPYQMTAEEMGFENVLDKDNFQERYGVSPSVMERQTDPIKESVQRLRAKVGKGTNIGLGTLVGVLKAMTPMFPNAADLAMRIPAVNDAVSKVVPGVGEKIRESSILAATENELRGAEKAQSKDGFWKSFGKGLANEGMWTQGLSELDNNLTLLSIAKKAEKEGFDNLPEKEQDLLTASALRVASEAANSDEKTALQIAGMSAAESIPYMLLFMLTSSPASLATSPVRSVIKKAAEKALKSGVSGKVASVVKGVARTASVGSKAAVMTAMQPTMYADMVERGTGKAILENGKYAGMEEAESAPMAMYKAFANSTIENLSEHSGSMLSGVTKGVGNVLKKVPALGGFISNVQKNNVLSGVTKMMKAVGFNGAPEEFFEEQVSTGLNSLLVGDSQFSDFVNWKQQLATLISVGATAGAMTTTGSIMSVPYKKQIRKRYEESMDKIYEYFTPEEFDQFSTSLSNMNIDSRPDFIAQVSDMKGFSPEQINDLIEFATRQAQFDGYAGAVSDYIEEEKVRVQDDINRVSNKDMGEVLEVNYGNTPTNIVGGFVVFDDEGYVDKNKSSQTIYYLDENGKRKMASPDKFGSLINRKPLADAYTEALGNVENDILIKEENDLAEPESQEQAQEDAITLAENGNQVETPDGVGEIAFVEEDENAAIVRLQDGRAKRYALPVLKPYKPIDPNAETVVEGQPAANGEEIVQTNEAIPEAVQTEQGVQVPSFPMDKEGNIDYKQINEPELYAQALQNEFEGDALSVIDEQIQSAQTNLDKASKNSDAIKRRRAMKTAQAEVDRLNKVKAILSPVEQSVNEMQPEIVENAEASPSGESNVTNLSQLSEEEYRQHVAQNSTDPIELADLYGQVKDETEYSQMMPWEAALLGRKVSKDSFIENSDKNNITGAMNKAWFSKDGKSLDVLAQELSEFGVPVTEQDIVNFMLLHPGNNVRKRSQLSVDVDRRFKEVVKELTGEDVGGIESNSGKLILAGLRAGQRSEQERQALPFSTYTIPDSVLNFFEETGINPEDFNTFEELRDAVAKEQENGTFVFPLGETDLQIINNIINHGIEQQANYANFASRVEKAGTKRAIEQPVLETEAGNQLQPIEAEGKQVDIEPTPEEIAEIESQLEKPKRSGSVIGIINEIATEQNLRDAEKEVENNNNSNEVQETKSNYRTQDGKQLNFTFAEGLQNTNESANVESGSNDVQREGDPILGTLNRELKDGEFCKVERIFTESKSFDFTAGNYIDSVHDVAYIFKQLEDESVENSFAVLVKDGKPTIIHLGMGVYTSTQSNGTAILAAAERINPDKIFFVHNHPSGNLRPSQADRNVYSQLYSLFGDKLEDAIIINLKSGMFAIFNSNYDIEQTNYTPIKSNPVKVYSFNKQVFDKDYDPSGNFMITSPNDVASFISGHRLGNRKKMNIMIINNGVVANMFTKYTAVTDENVEEVAKESVLMATNYGGIAVVVYGDIGNISDNSVSKLKKLIGIYSGGQISLLDFVSVEGNNYKSSIEEGLMEPAQEYPTNKVNEDGILFRDGNENVPLSYRFDNENCEYYVRFSDHIDDDMKRGWSSWNFGSGGFEGTKEDLEKAKKEAIENEDSFTISEYELWGDEIKKADIRELYPNYWVLVDNVNASGGLSAHELPGNLETLEDALYLVNKNQSIYDGTGDGQKFSASEGNVIYSKGNMHIIEVGTNEKQNSPSETDKIKAQAEKDGAFMKAPNGKPSNLNEEQWLQVRTKAFKEWFGDWENDPENASKVVDDNGEPKVVYHGSRNGEFDVFDPAKGNPTLGGGMYFSNSIEMSNKFAGPKGKVYEVFLKIVDPSYGQFTGSGADMQKSEYRDGGIFRKTNDDKYGKVDDKEFIVFESNQIKSATENTGEFNPNNDDIRFRDAEESLPEVKDGLVVLHNISSENLVRASRVGGLAMPSLAITKSGNQFLGFGDITLIGDKKMIDPKIKSNKVFGADAYTPTYPNIEYKVNNLDELHKETDKLPDRYRTSIENALINNIEDDGDSYLYENRYVRILFALSKGADIVKYNTVKSSVMSDYVRSIEAYDYFDIKDKEAIKQKMSEIFISELSDNAKSFYEKKGLIKNGSLSDDVIKRVFNSIKDEIRKEGTVDSNNTYDSALSFIEENNLSSEIKEYASNLYEKLNVSERIFKGYSQSGKRQYTPHTVENAVKDMRKEGIRGVQGMAGGLGRLRARLTPEFKSVDEIKSKQNKLKNKEDLKEAVDSIQEEYYSLHEKLKPYYKWNSERIVDSMSDLEEEISDLLKTGSSESFNKLPNELHEEIKKFAKDVVALPTEYFEAKPQRAVYFSDFSAALIPNDSSDRIRDILNKNNIPFREYSTNEERVSIVQDLSKEMGLRFREGESTQEVSNVEKEATTLADSLNTPIRVVRDVTEITNEDKRKEKRMRSAKGWYDPKTGEVTIVLPNAESVGDVQATILHEVVGHKGLRGLLGDKFEEMMDKIYKHLPKKERQKIMAAAMDKYKFDYRTATEEYLAEFVERDVMEPSLWQKIKSAIKSFFRNMGVNLEMSDPDIAYLLWKSKNRLMNGDTNIDTINKTAADVKAKEKFREAPYSEADVLSDQLDEAGKRAWERLSNEERTAHEIVNETAEVRKGIMKYFPTMDQTKKSMTDLIQGLFDNAVSLRNLQHLVAYVGGEIQSFENPYQFLTTIPSRNEYKMNKFVKDHFSKIGQAIKEMGVNPTTAQVYAYLKHGLERNEYMRKQDAENKKASLREKADAKINVLAERLDELSNLLDKADKQSEKKLLKEIDRINKEIENLNQEVELKASMYAETIVDKDYSGVFQVADMFIASSDREITVPLIESAIAQFENEHDTTKFWEAINGATRFSVQNEFEMGRLSKEARDKILSMYNYYIPLKGWEVKNANEEWDYVQSQGIPVSPIKKAFGRKSLASNPFENIGLAAQTSVMGGHKNLLKQHMLRMVRNHPMSLYRVSEVWEVFENGDWVQKAPEYSEDPEVYADNVVKFEEEMADLQNQKLAKKASGRLDVGRPITKYEAKEHEILVYENGKPYVIYINGNPDIARAVNLTSNKPYDVEMNDITGKDYMKKLLNGVYSLMRFTGQNLTSRNPAFIAANLVMDSQWALASAAAKEGKEYTGKLVGNYLSPSIHASIMRGIRGKLDETNPIDKMFGEFQRAGGETGYSDLFKLDDFSNMIKKELKPGISISDIFKIYTGPVDMLNKWAELTSRFAAFTTSRAVGRDVERSAYDAKEITLNFNRKGTGAFMGNWLKFAYLFAGAGLQGLYSIGNLALSKRSRKAATMVFAGTAMLGLIVPIINDMFLGGDDDDLYSKKPDYERKSNIMIRIPGTNSFFKFPVAQSLRPFYNIGESLYTIMKGNKTPGEATMDVISGFGMLLPFDPFGGNLAPTFAQPLLQVAANKDFFGKEIYKADSFTEYDPEFKRVFSSTSPMFVELSKALNSFSGGDEVTKGKINVNPAVMEHITEGYLGGAFKFINDIGKQVNGALEVAKGNPYPYDSRSYPIVGRFYTNTANNSDINFEYYKFVNDADELSHRIKKYQELGNKGDVESFDKAVKLMNTPEYQVSIIVNVYRKRIDGLNKKLKDSNLSGKDAEVFKEQIKELKKIMLNELNKETK